METTTEALVKDNSNDPFGIGNVKTLERLTTIEDKNTNLRTKNMRLRKRLSTNHNVYETKLINVSNKRDFYQQRLETAKQETRKCK